MTYDIYQFQSKRPETNKHNGAVWGGGVVVKNIKMGAMN